MKNLTKIALSLTFVFAISFQAIKPAHSIGLGVMVGEPTGLSIKYDPFAIGLAWSLDSYLHLHGDYWLMDQTLVRPVNWYLGFGLKIGLFGGGNDNNNDSSANLGLRIPIGIHGFFARKKLEWFLEIVPGLTVIPATDLDLGWALGLRFHF